MLLIFTNCNSDIYSLSLKESMICTNYLFTIATNTYFQTNLNVLLLITTCCDLNVAFYCMYLYVFSNMKFVQLAHFNLSVELKFKKMKKRRWYNHEHLYNYEQCINCRIVTSNHTMHSTNRWNTIHFCQEWLQGRNNKHLYYLILLQHLTIIDISQISRHNCLIHDAIKCL